jgi:hypothetical protein
MMTENTLTHESSQLASSIRPAIASSFKRKPKIWTRFAPHASWGDLQIEYAPIFKLSVCLAEPLADDLVLDDLVVLPATQCPQKRQDLYALAVNRYNKVVLSEDEARLHDVRTALTARPDMLVGDASSAIMSARVSGEHASELLSRGIDVDPTSIADGGYIRCQLDQTVVVVHRVNDGFLLHWPEPLTSYAVLWIDSIVRLGRE